MEGGTNCIDDIPCQGECDMSLYICINEEQGDGGDGEEVDDPICGMCVEGQYCRTEPEPHMCIDDSDPCKMECDGDDMCVYYVSNEDPVCVDAASYPCTSECGMGSACTVGPVEEASDAEEESLCRPWSNTAEGMEDEGYEVIGANVVVSDDGIADSQGVDSVTITFSISIETKSVGEFTAMLIDELAEVFDISMDDIYVTSVDTEEDGDNTMYTVTVIILDQDVAILFQRVWDCLVNEGTYDPADRSQACVDTGVFDTELLAAMATDETLEVSYSTTEVYECEDGTTTVDADDCAGMGGASTHAVSFGVVAAGVATIVLA
jgi:hypothetical protein